MKRIAQALVTLPVLVANLVAPQLAESRMLYHDLIFKAKHDENIIYGSWNGLDNRACAVIDGKAIFGIMDNDGKSFTMAKKKISIMQSELRNYSFSLHLPEKWWDSPQSKKCLNYTSYGKCFVNAGIPYYLNDPDESYISDEGVRKYKHNPRLRKIFKTRTKVFIESGIDNNPASRDGVTSLWAYFSFESMGISFGSKISSKFLVAEENLKCEGATYSNPKQ
jgi:hypothetical protein